MWSAPELFETLDSFVDDPVFMPLYRRYADTAGFPEIMGLLDRLGLKVDDGLVHIQHNSELNDIRVAITGE